MNPSKNPEAESIDALRSVISENTFQTLFENAYFGMVLVGTDGHFIKVNKAACDLFGYPQAELLGRTYKDLTHPDDLEANAALFADMLAGRCSHAKIAKRYIKKNGEVIWTLLSTSIMRKPSGAPDYIVTLFQDITEQKQTEFDLAEKEEQYRSTFEDAFDGILINDLDGQIVEANPAFCEMYGYERRELIGKNAAMLIRPADYPVLQTYLKTIGVDHKPFTGRAVSLKKDGSPIHVDIHGSPVTYHGKCHTMGIVRDVSAQVEDEAVMEQILASKTRDLSALVDVARVASASLDLNEVMEHSLDRVLDVMNCEMGAIHILNENNDDITLNAWRNVPEAIINEIKTLSIADSLPGRVLALGCPIVINDMLGDPATVPAAKRILGKRVYLGTPMKVKRQTVGILVIIGEAQRKFEQEEISLLESIADQIGVAVENARLYRQAEVLAITEERQRIAREIHDTIAQGLTAIKIQLDAVESALEKGQVETALKRLRNASEMSVQSLAEARRSVWALRSTDLSEKSISDSFRDSIRGLILGTDLDITCRIDNDLPDFPPALKIDLLRVMQEAVMNTIKHAQAKRLTVQLKYKDNTIHMKICDDGRGLPQDYLTKYKKAGDGFGLIAMQERIQRHGGKIRFDSQPQRGTCVIAAVGFEKSGG